MPWQLHTADRLRADHGPDRLLEHAEELKGLLERNELPMPQFPEMVWVQRRLADGVEVAVGVAQDGEDLRAYGWPSDKIEFIGTEELAVDPPAGSGGPPIILHWYRREG